MVHTSEQLGLHFSNKVAKGNMGAHQVAHVLPPLGDPLLKILKRQEELATYLLQQQAHHHILPKREIPVYDDDPLQYNHSSEHLNMALKKRLTAKSIICIFLSIY